MILLIQKRWKNFKQQTNQHQRIKQCQSQWLVTKSFQHFVVGEKVHKKYLINSNQGDTRKIRVWSRKMFLPIMTFGSSLFCIAVQPPLPAKFIFAALYHWSLDYDSTFLHVLATSLPPMHPSAEPETKMKNLEIWNLKHIVLMSVFTGIGRVKIEDLQSCCSTTKLLSTLNICLLFDKANLQCIGKLVIIIFQEHASASIHLM